MDKLMNKPQIIYRDLYIDDRGYVYGAFDNLDRYNIKRTYVVENFIRHTIRAWHGHKKADTYIHVIKGSAKVAAVKIDDNKESTVHIMSYKKPSLFYVPAGYYNGAMSLENNTILLIYSTITLEECKNDDWRKKHDSLHPDIWKVEQR